MYIGEAIESVLASTYSNFELIIVDDVSTDNTLAIVQRYAERDNRIRVYVNKSNLGDYPNRNQAARYASGKYIKYLDSDDKIFDFGLEYCITQMEKNPEAAIGMSLLYDMGVTDSICWRPEKIVREHLFDRPYLGIGPSGTIIRLDKFIEAGGFDTRFGVSSDMYFNIKMASSSPVVLLPKMYFYYREHEGQQKNNEKGYLAMGYLYFKELLEKVALPLRNDEINFLRRKLGKRHAVNLTRYLLRTGSFGDVKEVMRETNFGITDIVSGYFK
jgi:glycosyltransferase involved in cell wall biosynthesis